MPRPRVPGSSPLLGQYLVRNPAWNVWLRFSDLMIATRHGRADASPENVRTPKRVLVAVGGHLGDAVIASSVLPRLSRAFPGAEIGIVCGSWSRGVFESHPRVRWIHTVDHWKLSRVDASFLTRWLTTRRTRARALSEIRAVGYDAAVDLAPYFPNASRLLWKAGVPIRVGYTSGGDGPLLTSAVPWSPRDHVAEEHAVLLERLAPSSTRDAMGRPRYELADVPADAAAGVQRKLSALGVTRGGYVVAHMGAGHERKEWPVEKWTDVVRRLTEAGVRVVLTGAGERQAELARLVCGAVPGAVSLADQLDWTEFRAVVAGARVLLSVDTVAMHVAGAAGTPCVALMTGMDRPERWQPLGTAVTVLTERVPCAPCYRSTGCAEMSCIRDVTTESVLDAARGYLEAR